MKTTYQGIDYSGPGSTSNRDAVTGIRYGVISQNSVESEAVQDVYFGPHSRDLAMEDAVEQAKKRIMQCYEEDLYDDKKGELKKVLKDFVRDRFIDDRIEELMDLFDEQVSSPPGGKPNLPDVEHVWAVVEQDFGDNCGEHEPSPLYEHDGYQITKCLDSDLFISKSPYFTYAQFCSPCVPGACNLDSPADLSNSGPYATGEGEEFDNMKLRADRAGDDGWPRCYCLGHDWFEGGKAPYPVFNMGGAEIFPTKE